MANYVCSGAKTKCMMGDSQASIEVLPDRKVRLDGLFMANISDNKPLVNIKPFGKCKSLLNPVVAAATAANNGVLKPMPCIPKTTVPWVGGETGVRIKGHPALLDTCKLQCMWGGAIEITNDGQTGEEVAAKVNSRGHEFDARGFGKLFDIDFSL